jgi:hypothetical protein
MSARTAKPSELIHTVQYEYEYMPQGGRPARRMPFNDFLMRCAAVLGRTTNRGDRGVDFVALHERNPDQSSEFAEASRPRGREGPRLLDQGSNRAGYYDTAVYKSRAPKRSVFHVHLITKHKS